MNCLPIELMREDEALNLSLRDPLPLEAALLPFVPGVHGIKASISQDPGNSAREGSDQGVYVPAPFKKLLFVDHARPVAYAATATQIMRLDYTTGQAVIAFFRTTSLSADWPNRQLLTYQTDE
jgi:hypothetical protein